MPIEAPRHDVDGGSPCRTSTTTRLPRRTVRHISRFRILRPTHIVQPFVVEGTRIVGFHHHIAHNLPVSRIGRTLAVRAIALNGTMHIVGLASSPDAMDGIDQFIVALERSGLLHIAIYGFGHHLPFLQFAWPSADFHFAEHIPGKAGGIVFLSFAFEGIAVRTHCRFANITDVDALSGRTFHIVQTHPTRNLFPEIDAIASFSQSFHLLGLERFHHSVGRSVLSHQTAVGLLSQHGLFPCGIIETRGVPSVLFQACIVVFALINHVAHNGAFGDFPRRITHDDILSTILI